MEEVINRIAVALPTEGVDRNLRAASTAPVPEVSPSPRRAWIEIISLRSMSITLTVALPTEGVDRNWSCGILKYKQISVALPTEGVDRN